MFDRKVDPFLQYIEDLDEWDPETDIDRLNTFLTFYMGAEDNDLSQWASRFMFVGAIQRAYQPGCKLDEMLILVGDQGLGKSSLIQYSLPDDSFYSSSLHFDDPLKVQVEATLGKVFVECPEMVGSTKADVRKIKAFLTKTQDEVRLSYARNTPSIPRRFIIVGSTNDEESLPNDHTGNRRFVPVKLNWPLDVDKLKQIRDRLWAEALYLYKQGVRANLPEHLWKPAAVNAEQHRNRDEIEDLIIDARLTKEYYSMHEIKAEIPALDKYSGKRIGNALRVLGWHKRQKQVSGMRVMRWFTPK